MGGIRVTHGGLKNVDYILFGNLKNRDHRCENVIKVDPTDTGREGVDLNELG